MSQSAIEVHEIEQGTEQWHTLRAGLPTASEFSKLVTGTGKKSTQLFDYAATLAAELYAGKPLERWEGNSATERGHEIEPLARSNYEFQNDVEIVQVGFITNFGAGCSPDGLVGSAGLIEIKSQLPKGHVQTLAHYQKNGGPPSGYLPQVQGQLLVCERDWCDLCFYHPDLPSLTIRVERDESYIRELVKGIQLVIEQRDELVSMLESA
jgi:hypothetical protein